MKIVERYKKRKTNLSFESFLLFYRDAYRFKRTQKFSRGFTKYVQVMIAGLTTTL